ncbi:rna-directed dna polymerase from mobile element jockey-like [Limosa lapponica baueri]|uniref:Rna-directed dna polymerase from mobile element jockey-like n=1 Tax=Limosa lapponica baueri TaxID=1758121 RepID=A0A2I0U5Q6_LIMLA|nr:rna-directed dna polymerase from mobile element jockey-like [Limosa lapponica baueri]
MGNKQEELEAIVQQDSYDVVAITETWWDEGHNWNAAMNGYKLFRRNRMKGKANNGDFVLEVCYRPPNQDEQTDEVFYKWLAEDSQLPALVLVGDFNLPDICWKYNTAESRQARRFLEYMEDNFLTQLVPMSCVTVVKTQDDPMGQRRLEPSGWGQSAKEDTWIPHYSSACNRDCRGDRSKADGNLKKLPSTPEVFPEKSVRLNRGYDATLSVQTQQNLTLRKIPILALLPFVLKKQVPTQ